MNFLKISFITGLIAFVSSQANSQETEQLTLKKSIQIAIANSKTLDKTLNSIEIQNSIIKTKYGSLLPSLSFTSGWQRTNQVNSGTGYNINGINVVTGARDTTTDNFNMGLRSDVLLFNGLANYDALDLAKMNKQTYFFQLETQRQDLVLKVISDYITILKNEQILKINVATLEDSKSQLEKIKIFVQVGKKTLSDIYNQDADVAQKELAVEQSKNNVDKSTADLVFDLNLPQNRSYTVNEEEFNTNVNAADLQSYVDKNSNIDALTRVAYGNRYDYKSSEYTIRINQAQHEINRSNLIFPSLSGFGSYNWSGDKFQNIRNSRVFTVGLTLSYPIFQGWQTSSLEDQSEVAILSAKDDLEQIKNQIVVQIKKATLDLKSNLKQIEISDREIKAAEQNKFAAEESYRVGLNTLLDVQTAAIKYNNALIDKSNSVYNFILAQKQLEYYQGLIKY
jgi:outer membrane protein